MQQIQVRLAELESRLAFQDATIEELNQIVTRHELEAIALREQIKLLAQKLKHLQPVMLAQHTEEKPPHY